MPKRIFLFASLCSIALNLLVARAQGPASFPEDKGVALDALKRQPAWAAESVFYQIFPEGFRNGDTSMEQIAHGRPMPIAPQMRQIWEGMRGPYQLVMNGAITAKEAAREMQREAEKNIADSNL